MDRIDRNRAVYSSGHLAHRFDSLGAWLDSGEWASVQSVLPFVRNQPLLDIGIGAGRTVGLLKLVSEDYLGIDYSPALLERARAHYPDEKLILADARDLSDLPASHYRLVMFSFNGIDSLDHDDRMKVMAQVSRVMHPDGYFVYSTLNKEGGLFDEPPWHAEIAPLSTLPERFLRSAARVVLRNADFRRKWRQWWSLRHETRNHGDWGEGRLNGPGSGLVVHWTTPGATIAELAQAGMEPVAMFGLDGRSFDGPSKEPYFYVVARLRG